MNRIRTRLVGAAVLTSAAVALSGCVTIESSGGEQQEPSRSAPPPTDPPPETSSRRSPPDQQTSETSAEAESKPASATTPLEDDHGEPAWCGSQQLVGTSFEIIQNRRAGSASGTLTVTNEGDETCTINPRTTTLRVSSMDRSIPNGDGAWYKRTLPPAPVRTELAPGESATAEMRSWETGGGCAAVLQGAGVQTLPEDEELLVSATGPDGEPESSGLCGDLSVHYSWFRTS